MLSPGCSTAIRGCRLRWPEDVNGYASAHDGDQRERAPIRSVETIVLRSGTPNPRREAACR